MTKHEAVVVTAYTQICIGDFSEYKKYAEKLLGRPICTHELMYDDVVEEIRRKSKPDFMAIKIEDEKGRN